MILSLILNVSGISSSIKTVLSVTANMDSHGDVFYLTTCGCARTSNGFLYFHRQSYSWSYCVKHHTQDKTYAMSNTTHDGDNP